mmetsp:Transcript_46371/g.135065  ORF Transcript_46371/g.135065 Transcript_46371/m.135065 type:complete len:174 (+) Transcript_46371:132-653(+)
MPPVVVQATHVTPAGQTGAAPMGNVVQANPVAGAPGQVAMGQVVQGQVVGNPIGVVGLSDPYDGPRPHGGAYGGGLGPSSMGGMYIDTRGDPNDGPVEEPTCAAIIACCCCCWCVGLVAIFKSMEVGRANAVGEFQLARQKRKEAMMWIYATIALGVLVYGINTVIRLSSEQQ